VHSEHGAGRLRDELGLDPAKVHVIPHGVLDNLAAVPPAPLFAKTKPVVLFFGLIRPYKGLDVLLEAWREARPDAELWVVGMPRMDASSIHGPDVRTALRFVSGAELAGAFEAADLVVLPYREIDQSGVLFTALAFGKPLLLSDVGGFGEIEGAELVPPGDPHALASALTALLGDPAKLRSMAAASRAAADGPLGWDSIAQRTLALYAAVQA
jgi:glycosyltransferase involved in cell wall biosynthesis